MRKLRANFGIKLYTLNMTWEEFQNEIKNLAAKIDYVPDVIIGIARGGVIPSVLLSKLLKVKDMYVLKVRKEGEQRLVMAEIFTDVSNKKVLLIEDMLESGKSLVVAKAYLESKGASVKTACLYTMPITETKPDYSLKEVDEVAHFPWD